MVDATETSLNVLMDAYKVYQDTLKHNESTTGVDSSIEPDDKNPQQLLLDAYNKYTCLTRTDASSVSSNDKSNLLEEALRFCNQQNTLRKPAAASSTAKSVTQSMTSTGNHQTNNSKPVATVAPQKRPNDKPSTILENTAYKSGAKQENNENGLNPTESKSQLSDKPNKGQITMVADQGGRTYTKIAPPNTDFRSLAPSVGSAFHPQLDAKRLRLDPGLRHLQDSSKKLIRSTSVPVKYAEGEENTPPPHRLLCRTGSCVSDSTKRKLKNTILAKTSAALVRKPSITDHEMHQLRVRLDPYDTDSSESEDEEDFPEEEVSSGRKRKFSDESPTPVPASEHPSLISTHQPSVITTAEST